MIDKQKNYQVFAKKCAFFVLLASFALQAISIETASSSVANTKEKSVALVAKLTISPEFVSEFLLLAKRTMAKTLRESGCIHYAYYIDPENNQTVVFVEQWSSENELIEHLKQAHTRALFTRLEDIRTKPDMVRVYYVDRVAEQLPNVSE